MSTDTNTDTNYSKVGEFHLMFGHPMQSEPQENVFDENPKLVEFRLSQIEEELEELKTAIEQRDFVECIDAVCDLMYFVYGTCHAFGVNFDTLQSKPKVRVFECPTNNVKIFTNDMSALHTQTTMLTQALSLLTLSCEEKDFNSVVKFLTKLEAVCHTFGTLLGVDIDMCFEEVHRSNMTKLCLSEEEAQLTVQSYLDTKAVRNTALETATSDAEKKEINEKYKSYEDPDYRNAEITKYWIVYDKSTTKILKSINFELPKLASVIGLVAEVVASEESTDEVASEESTDEVASEESTDEVAEVVALEDSTELAESLELAKLVESLELVELVESSVDETVDEIITIIEDESENNNSENVELLQC